MSEALMPESPKPLSFDDLLDVDLALTNMSCGKRQDLYILINLIFFINI